MNFSKLRHRIIFLRPTDMIKNSMGETVPRYKPFKPYADTEYGCHLEDLIIGNSYTVEFIEAELKREIEDALKQNPQITSVTNFNITRNTNAITVTLEVVLNDEGRNTVTVTV